MKKRKLREKRNGRRVKRIAKVGEKKIEEKLLISREEQQTYVLTKAI